MSSDAWVIPSISSRSSSPNDPVRSPVSFDGRHFIDSNSGQIITLRGVSLSGYSKIPSKPEGLTQTKEVFLRHRDVSFIQHPLGLDDVDHYLSKLVSWGFNLIRLVVCWEALEHSGPGIYDFDYIEYIKKLISKCQNFGLKVLIDAHQDVWSRFSGGSGAPGWTLELAGFEIANLIQTGAVALQQTGAPGVWPTGYQKLVAGTMFTLFFAGSTFAPHRKVKRNLHSRWAKEENSEETITLQEFLQFSMIEAFGQLAHALSTFECVIGFEPMNEPHRGFINLYSPYQWNSRTDLFLYDCPSFLEAVALGEGHPQRVKVFTPIWPVPSFHFHKRLITPQVRAWKSSVECIWKQHGVWKWDSIKKKSIISKPNYFNLDPISGKPYDFYNQFYFPFIVNFAKRIQMNRPDWLIPVGPIPNEFYPSWELNQRPPNLIAAPHFYDLFSLVHKSHGSMTMDVQGICMNKPIWKWMYFGLAGAKKNYAGQISNIINSVYQKLGESPCLIGEFGICMDLNKGEAFKSGNFYWQHHQMDALLAAMEFNLVSFVLWNFNPYNTDKDGDGWNGENFSFISQSAKDGSSPYSQPRILSAIVRPYAQKVSGIPTGLSYNSRTSKFEFSHKNPDDKKFNSTTTVIFLPNDRFPIRDTQVFVSDGTFHHDDSNQTLTWNHSNIEPGFNHYIKVNGVIQSDNSIYKNPNKFAQFLGLTLLILLLLFMFWFIQKKILTKYIYPF